MTKTVLICSMLLIISSWETLALTHLIYESYGDGSPTSEIFTAWIQNRTIGCAIVKKVDVGNNTEVITQTIEYPRCKEDEFCSMTESLLVRLRKEQKNNRGTGSNLLSTIIFIDNDQDFGLSCYKEMAQVGLVNDIHNYLHTNFDRIIKANTNLVSVRKVMMDKPYVQAIQVDLKDVLAHPQDYVGKRVKISGYYWQDGEISAISVNRPQKGTPYPYDESIWASDVADEKTRNRLLKEHGHFIQVSGMIIAGIKNGKTMAGSLGLWKVEIVGVTFKSGAE